MAQHDPATSARFWHRAPFESAAWVRREDCEGARAAERWHQWLHECRRCLSAAHAAAGGDAKARAAERRSALRALARLAVTAPHDIERELKAIGHRCGVVLPHPDAELRPPPDARDDFADALPPIR